MKILILSMTNLVFKSMKSPLRSKIKKRLNRLQKMKIQKNNY